MTIASSSGLSDKDIERMVADAEQYAEADKARKTIIEEANKAESVCADTEKGRLTYVVLFVDVLTHTSHSDERVQGAARRDREGEG